MHFNSTIFRLVGDILILNTNLHERNLQIDLDNVWPNGEIFFQFQEGFVQSREAFIRSKMIELESISENALSFIERQDEDFWVLITEFDEGCYANVGRLQKELQPQLLNIGNGCLTNDLVKHELMHAIGFFHEHAREDRDEYVEVFYENIRSGFEDNFIIASNTNNLNLTYDYRSIMHYSKTAFSKNGQPTLQSKTNTPIQPANDMTTNDVNKIRILYNQDVINDSNSLKIKYYYYFSLSIIYQQLRHLL